MKDTSFNDSITTAEQKGMRTAWSNEDFELWILLHFSLIHTCIAHVPKFTIW